jgi:probable rRNA maturation factor
VTHAAEEPAGEREILLQNPNRYLDVDRAALGDWLARLLDEVAPDGGSFAARFVGRRAIAGLNQRYRAKGSPTDVLSFPGELTPEGRHLGDVVICVPVARRQAEGALQPELQRLLLHGVLHCLGYDHEADRGEMRRLERRLRRRFISTP